jgi:Flp pilus assembly protein TadG
MICRPANRRARNGSVLIYVMAALVAFTGLVSLAVDLGHARMVKTQLQTAADAAARHAAAGLSSGISTVQSNAVAAGGYNTADGTSVVIDPNNDVDFGTWSNGTFTVLTGSARSSANAVRVWARRTAANGNSVQMFFGGLIGKSSADVTAYSIASLTTQGGGGGIIGLSSLTTSGTSMTDSYNSANGPYSAGSSRSNGSVESNANISLSGGTTVHGNASPGPGDTATGGTVTGSRTPLSSPLNEPNASAGSYATTNDNALISAYMSGSDFTMSGGGSSTLPAGHYYVHNLTISGGHSLIITSATTFYVTGKVDISGGSIAANAPSDLQVNVIGTGTVTLSGGSGFTLEVYAPQSSVTVSGGSNFYGSVVGNTLTISSSSVHSDEAISSGGGAGVSTVQ